LVETFLFFGRLHFKLLTGLLSGRLLEFVSILEDVEDFLGADLELLEAVFVFKEVVDELEVGDVFVIV
jgi:hypothetical protein